MAYVSPAVVGAHEFWIEPDAHLVAPGDRVEANLKVGQDYSGSTYPFLPGRSVVFQLTDRAGTRDIDSTVGDIPAARLSDLSEGLQIISYVSVPERLTFSDWEVFRFYVGYEGNDWAVAAHLAADLPQTGFTEAYTRHAKALVQVGPPGAADVDRPLGLRFELVALASPYRLAEGQTVLPVQLLWQGAPLVNQQINIFHKAEAVTLRSVKTGADGRALVPVGDKGRYLLNAVHMKLDADNPENVWESDWASLSFEIGEAP